MKALQKYPRWETTVPERDSFQISLVSLVFVLGSELK